jgi:hypothetical protein
MTKTMEPHFKKLIGEISMYAMDMLIEEQCLPVAGEGTPERALLKEILNTNDMDKRHLMCAKYLGYTDQIVALEAWIAKKKKKKR